MKNKLIMGVVGITISIIVLSSALVPVVDGASWNTKEYSNVENSVFYMESPADAEPGKTVLYTWTKDTGILKINDTEIDVSSQPAYTWADLGLGMLRIQQGGVNDFSATLVVNDDHTATLTYSTGSIQTVSARGHYAIDTPSKYVMMKYGAPGTYYSKDQPILFVGVTTISNVLHTFRMEMGEDLDWMNVVPSTSTVDNVNIFESNVYETKNVHSLSKITFNCTDVNGVTALCTYSYGIAYATVTGYNAFSGFSILAVIPVLIIVGIMVYAVRIIQNRNE